MIGSSLFEPPTRERLLPAFGKFIIHDFLGVLIGIASFKPIHAVFTTNEPLSLAMRVWLGVSLILIFVWLSAKVYDRLVDVKYGGASTEHVRQLVEKVSELENKNAILTQETEEVRAETKRAREEQELWEQRANRYFLSSEALNTDLQLLIDKFSASPEAIPSKEWYCRRFLTSVAQLMEHLSRRPEQSFRTTLMEWAGKDDRKPYMCITYFHCPSTDGNCISWRSHTRFSASDGTLAGYVLQHGHEVAIHDIPVERRLFDDGAHHLFTEIFPFRQLHDQQDYIRAILSIPIRLRSDHASDTLFVLNIDSNKPFFSPQTRERMDRFYTLLKPWLKSLVFYTLLLAHHDALEAKDDNLA